MESVIHGASLSRQVIILLGQYLLNTFIIQSLSYPTCSLGSFLRKCVSQSI